MGSIPTRWSPAATESETGTPATTEELRYGLRVTVACLGAPDELKTARRWRSPDRAPSNSTTFTDRCEGSGRGRSGGDAEIFGGSLEGLEGWSVKQDETNVLDVALSLHDGPERQRRRFLDRVTVNAR